MRFLVVGSKGMLGRAWLELLSAAGHQVVGRDLPELDILSPSLIDGAVVESRPDAIINCAAWTDVDGAEAKEDLARRVNVEGVVNLTQPCEAMGIKLIHYSTDYVFNGVGTRPYRVDDDTGPTNAYGRTKLEGERALARSSCDWLCVRTSWLYAPWGKNFVRTIDSLAKQKPSLRVVRDQVGRPTSAEHLARVTLGLIERDVRGMAHVTDGGECSWYDFAREIVRLGGSSCRIDACTSEEYPRPAKRPAYSVLDLSRTESVVGPMTPWQQNLAVVMQRLER